jgi:c-di-GMP-related signal transduction protein
MKIKISEFKYRLVNGVDGLIDTYFAGGGVKERFINATAKIIINQNVDKIDDFIGLFADKDGYVDTDLIINEYSKAFGTDKIILDLRDYVNNDLVRRLLPNKALAIKIEDVVDILK